MLMMEYEHEHHGICRNGLVVGPASGGYRGRRTGYPAASIAPDRRQQFGPPFRELAGRDGIAWRFFDLFDDLSARGRQIGIFILEREIFAVGDWPRI